MGKHNTNATVIMAKCKVLNKAFGVRAQKEGSVWYFTWAFKLADKTAKNEGYDQTKISGEINLDTGYPGCPYCEASYFYQCGNCKKIVCYAGHEEQATCPHCGNTSGFRSVDSFDEITGGAF